MRALIPAGPRQFVAAFVEGLRVIARHTRASRRTGRDRRARGVEASRGTE
ncbi:hypothetical protein ABZU32_33920 [Sphaerisporangium sp. NPDC005288]